MKVMKFILTISLVFVTTCCTAQNAQRVQNNTQETSRNIQKTKRENQATQVRTENTESKDCLLYEPTVVELKGSLIIKTFFGSPNFGENPETDSKENSWILSLTTPISVCAKTEGDPILSPSVENVRELQLVLPKPHKELIGKNIIVKGTLFHAHTGHHHTDVLMEVESISLDETN